MINKFIKPFTKTFNQMDLCTKSFSQADSYLRFIKRLKNDYLNIQYNTVITSKRTTDRTL